MNWLDSDDSLLQLASTMIVDDETMKILARLVKKLQKSEDEKLRELCNSWI